VNFLDFVRNAKWLGRQRVLEYSRLLACIFVLGGLFLLLIGTDVIRLRSGGGGTDFTSFWTAARTTASSGAVQAYDPTAAQAQQGYSRYYPFMLPPSALLLFMPFALTGFAVGLILWVCLTYSVYLLMARRLLKDAIWPIAVLPAAFVNAVHGQMAALMTALFCGAALLWKLRPFLAGVLLGGFILKPHLALLFPIAMIAGRQWRIILGAAVSSAAIVACSILAFGPGAWGAFFDNLQFGRQLLEQHSELWPKMTSLFASAMLAGATVTTAYVVQGALTAAMALLTLRIWSKGPSDFAFASLAACAVLATPYVYHYDLMLLIVPLCWIAQDGMAKGFAPWAKAGMVQAYMLPLLAMPIALATGLNLAWAGVLALLMVLLLQRARSPAPERNPGPAATTQASR
jgi:hypothetical protein